MGDRRSKVSGGITLTRRQVRRLGGVMGICISLALFSAGWLAQALFGSTLTNGVWFVLTMIAFPVMPILGIPATGGNSRILLAVIVSLVLWWFLGQIAALKASSRPIVGWREWTKEFLFFATGITAGTIGGLLLAAYFLGVL